MNERLRTTIGHVSGLNYLHICPLAEHCDVPEPESLHMHGSDLAAGDWLLPDLWCFDAENLAVSGQRLKLHFHAYIFFSHSISVIFRVRSAKAVKITDAALLKRLGIICGAIGTCLLVRTLVSPPDVVVGRTADDLKAFLCKTDWWDYTFTSSK